MVDLVPGASVVGKPCHKVVLCVLEASAGNHKAVRKYIANLYTAFSSIFNIPHDNVYSLLTNDSINYIVELPIDESSSACKSYSEGVTF